jgi:hypothetical protein
MEVRKMKEPNFKLKGMLIAKYGSIYKASQDLDIREDRLSRIYYRRVKPSKSELRIIAWKLQKSISELFSEV